MHNSEHNTFGHVKNPFHKIHKWIIGKDDSIFDIVDNINRLVSNSERRTKQKKSGQNTKFHAVNSVQWSVYIPFHRNRSSDVNVFFSCIVYFLFSFLIENSLNHKNAKYTRRMHADNKWDSWKCWRNDKKRKMQNEYICCCCCCFFSLVGNWSTVGWLQPRISALRFKTKEFMWIFNSIHLYLQPTCIYYYYYYLSFTLHIANHSL